jgi:transposase
MYQGKGIPERMRKRIIKLYFEEGIARKEIAKILDLNYYTILKYSSAKEFKRRKRRK